MKQSVITVNVHTTESCNISCTNLGSEYVDRNIFLIDDVCVYASAEVLRRIVDTINERLAIIAAG
jgi:hypothetical protein